jgi:hypothetical protein
LVLEYNAEDDDLGTQGNRSSNVPSTLMTITIHISSSAQGTAKNEQLVAFLEEEEVLVISEAIPLFSK